MRTFGQQLFGRFVRIYPRFFDGITSMFEFLENVDGYIHVEVRKLYRDAELPHFTSERLDDRKLTLTYRSTRPFADLAEGLILGCAAHYGDPVAVSREQIHDSTGSGTRFLIERR